MEGAKEALPKDVETRLIASLHPLAMLNAAGFLILLLKVKPTFPSSRQYDHPENILSHIFQIDLHMLMHFHKYHAGATACTKADRW